MRISLVTFFALTLTLAWQAAAIAAPQTGSVAADTGAIPAEGDEKKKKKTKSGDEEPECE